MFRNSRLVGDAQLSSVFKTPSSWTLLKNKGSVSCQCYSVFMSWVPCDFAETNRRAFLQTSTSLTFVITAYKADFPLTTP